MIVAISWRDNNIRQQRFDQIERRFINPVIIIIIFKIIIKYIGLYSFACKGQLSSCFDITHHYIFK